MSQSLSFQPSHPPAGTLRGAILRGVLSLCLLLAVAARAPAQTPSTEPLLQQSALTYLGAFALPTATYGTSNFTYGGHGITPYHDPNTGKFTLFMEGFMQNPGQVAQVQVPTSFVNSTNWNSLPMATVLQNFADFTNGKLGNVDPTNTGNATFIYGLLAYGGRLIAGASNSYSSTQQVSHGVGSLTLSSSGFQGFFPMSAGAPPRAVGGPMTPIPPEWQSAFGGPALTGECCLSIISTTSAGPSATVFDPATVGSSNPIPGTTVLFYPLSAEVCGASGCEATQNSIFNLTSRFGGMAFPPGTRTVMFVGATGIGPYCYGTAAACNNDQALSDVKGPHAQPYQYQIWVYDANQLVAVKNGQAAASSPKPYAIWVLNDMPNSGNPNIAGAGYDPQTGMLFITQDYGAQPRVEVYQVSGTTTTSTSTGTTGSSTPAQPDPPTNVTVQ
jgi:hypothetical protein